MAVVAPALVAGAVAAPLIGGIIGNMSSAAQRAAAAAAAQNAVNTIQSTGAGPDLARQIYLKEFQSAGVLTPELEQAINTGPSQVAQIKEDPSTRDAQMKALNLLAQKSQSGLSPIDMANLNQIQTQIATQNEGRRQAIMQNFASRGQAGSGNELLAALQNSQSGANSANSQGLGVAAQAQQAAAQALSQYGQLGGQVRGQDFSNAQVKANAADEFNRFNVSNQIAQQARNVANQNAAQSYNVQNNQNISNANTNQANQEQLRQRAAEQQMYTNKFNQNVAEANAYNGQASNLTNQANSTAAQWAGMGSGVGAGASAGLNAYAKNPNLFGSNSSDNSVVNGQGVASDGTGSTTGNIS